MTQLIAAAAITLALTPAFSTPASAQPAACIGDCNGDAEVTVDELITLVNVVLENAPIADCEAGDANGDGVVTVDEIVKAVDKALTGCPVPPTVTPTTSPVATATPAPNAFSGAEVVEASSRVAMATMRSIQILDFGFVGAGGSARSISAPPIDSRARGPLGVSDGAAADSTACANGGSKDETCVESSGTSTRTTVFTTCSEPDSSSGSIVTRNGTVVRTAAGVACSSAQIPPTADATLRFVDFSESLVDAAGDAITVTAPGLVLARDANGSRITANGNQEIDNQTTGEDFRQRFTDFVVTELPQPDGSVLVTEDGGTVVDCLGAVQFDTKIPIRMRPQAACPSDGKFEVTRPVPATSAAVTESKGGAVASAASLPLDAAPPQGAAAAQNAGYREAAFRAINGPVYQVLQNTNGDPELGAEDIQITTLVGSFSKELAGCAEPRTAVAVVATASGAAFPLSGVFKSDRIPDASAPCFNVNANGGDGAVCIGPDCTADCVCHAGANCRSFTIANGTVLSAGTPNVPAAFLVNTLSTVGQPCDGFGGRATYAFGGSGPTTDASLCSRLPADGFSLPSMPSAYGGVNGSTVIFAYQTPSTQPFSTGATGFAIDHDGVNAEGCIGSDRVVGGVVSLLPSVRPPRVEFTAAGGVGFDFNGDLNVDKLFTTCTSAALPQCGGAPLPTPVPTPATPVACPGFVLPNLRTAGANGDTTAAPNALGGATCGGGGDKASDVAFAYKAPATGFYTIDTIGSAFDTVLSVRADSCSGPELACNDDVGDGSLQSQVGVSLTAGQSVVIVVDGFGTQSGRFDLNVNFSPTGSTPTPTPTVVSAPGQLPDLVVTTLTAPSSGRVDERIAVSATVKNQGLLDAGAFQVAFVYSSDATITPDDTPSGFLCVFSGLAAGSSITCSGPIGVPSALTPGHYFLGAFADPTDQVAEGNEANNGRAADTGPIVISASLATPTRTATAATVTPTSTRTASPSQPPTVTPTPMVTSTATQTPPATTTQTPSVTATRTSTATATRTITPTLGPSMALTLSPRVLTLAPNGGQATLSVSIPQAAVTPVTVSFTVADINVASAPPTAMIGVGQTSAQVMVQGKNLGATTLSASGPGNGSASIYVTAPFAGNGTFVAQVVSVDVPVEPTPTGPISALVLGPAVSVQVPTSAATASPISANVSAPPVAVQVAAASPTSGPISASVGAPPVAVQVVAAPATPPPVSAEIFAAPVGVQLQQ